MGAMWSTTGVTLAEDAGKQNEPHLATIAQFPHEATALISDCVRVQAVIRTLQAEALMRDWQLARDEKPPEKIAPLT